MTRPAADVAGRLRGVLVVVLLAVAAVLIPAAVAGRLPLDAGPGRPALGHFAHLGHFAQPGHAGAGMRARPTSGRDRHGRTVEGGTSALVRAGAGVTSLDVQGPAGAVLLLLLAVFALAAFPTRRPCQAGAAGRPVAVRGGRGPPRRGTPRTA